MQHYCQVLLDHGAKTNVFGLAPKYLKTPLHRARTQKVVRLLLKYGVDCNAIAGLQEGSVFDIFLKKHPQAVEEIMNAGIKTNGQCLDSGDLQIIFDFEIFFREGTVLSLIHI